MGTKRIINMNATTDFESDDNIVVDSETAGTRKMAQSVLKEKLREDCLAGIHNLTTTTDFATGDTIVVDNATDGPRGMNKDVLLAKTAENALGSIKNLPTTIPAFRTGDVIPVDGPSGTAKMSKDDLLRVTAENALVSTKAFVSKKLIPSFKYSQFGHNEDLYNNTTVEVLSGQSGWRIWSYTLGKGIDWKGKTFFVFIDDKALFTQACVCKNMYNQIGNDASNRVTSSDVIEVENGYLLEFNIVSTLADSDDVYIVFGTNVFPVATSYLTMYFAVESSTKYVKDTLYVRYDYVEKAELDSATDAIVSAMPQKIPRGTSYVHPYLNVVVDAFRDFVVTCKWDYSGYAIFSFDLGLSSDYKGKNLSVFSDNNKFHSVSLVNVPDSIAAPKVQKRLSDFDVVDGGYEFTFPKNSFDSFADSDHVYVAFSLYRPTAGAIGKFCASMDSSEKVLWNSALFPMTSPSQKDIKQYANKLYKKGFWTLGDSLCHNTWQKYIVEYSGCVWSSSLNTKANKPISWGGSYSYAQADDGTQARAINLVSYKGTNPIDYVLIENVNDRNYNSNEIGSITDKAWMRSIKKQIAVPDATPDVPAWIASNWSSIVAGIDAADKKKGYIMSFNSSAGGNARGSEITFSGSVTTEGDVTITLDGLNFAVHVTTSMTLEDVVDACIQYNYGAGWTDVKTGADSFKIYYYTDTSKRATVNTGSTGLSATVADATGENVYNLFYEEDTSAGFDDMSNWSHHNRSLYATYKGVIEYLMTELPTAKLAWFIPWAFGVNFESTTYKNDDGSWSNDKFTASSAFTNAMAIADVQRNVAKKYGIKVIDMFVDGNLNIDNIETYFYTNNIHPKEEGYKVFSDFVNEHA